MSLTSYATPNAAILAPTSFALRASKAGLCFDKDDIVESFQYFGIYIDDHYSRYYQPSRWTWVIIVLNKSCSIGINKTIAR